MPVNQKCKVDIFHSIPVMLLYNNYASDSNNSPV